MEQIGFIGALDKKDLLLNIAKILTLLGKRVLIVDATMIQRFRYIVPIVSNGQSRTYISEYQGIDVALGFMNLNSIVQYLGQTLTYDYILIDTDNIQTVNSFALPRLNKNFFVTSYDEYELQKGMEIFNFLQTPMELYKIIVSSDITKKEEDYLDYLMGQTSSKWKEEKIMFPDSDQDRKVTLENQLSKEIKFKRHTQGYKNCLEYITSLVAGESIDQREIKQAIKKW